MLLKKSLTRFLITPLAIAALLLLSGGVLAQTDTGRIAGTITDQNGAVVSNASITVDERIRALERELRQQNRVLAEMRAIIAEQECSIETLSARAAGSEQTVADQKKVAAYVTSPSAQNQAPTLEDRVKKIEGKVLAIGPFRFSGDFRLRFDGIFRKADPTPPAGFAALTHQQNARMRYRLRLNFDTDIDSKVSFHGQLATGPTNNALTMDQDFGETATRHPFFISEAWIDFHPNKVTQLQAGRLQEIFADNSRFLFDDDIRFNGFNEKYTVAFKRNALKISNLELRAGQYILSNPNVAIVVAGSPLAQAGGGIGSTGRRPKPFYHGVRVNQKVKHRWSSWFVGAGCNPGFLSDWESSQPR